MCPNPTISGHSGYKLSRCILMHFFHDQSVPRTHDFTCVLACIYLYTIGMIRFDKTVVRLKIKHMMIYLWFRLLVRDDKGE